MSAPFFQVTIEGEDVSDYLERLEVEESDAQANMATLTFGDHSLVLSDILHEGATVEIDLGRDVHALIFRGILTEIRAEFPSQGLPQVVVMAMENLIQLGLKPRTRIWRNTTVSQIVRDIAQDNGLRPGTIEPIEDAWIGARPYTQIEETDLAFLFRLAQDYDSKLYVDVKPDKPGDTLNFVSTRGLLKAEPIEESLVFNVNLENFSTTSSVFAPVQPRRLVTTDPQTGDRVEIQEELAQTQDAAWVPNADRLARLGDGADRLTCLVAKTEPKRERLSQFWQVPPRAVGAASRSAAQHGGTFGDSARRLGQTATGRAVGSVWLQPCCLVEVEDYGGRWSGNWYLSEVKHQIDVRQRSYLCSFTCTR